MTSKRVLIAGGGGFIGSHLTELFLNKGDQVWIIDNFLTSSPDKIARFKTNPQFHLVQDDLLNVNKIKTLLHQSFDVIYHLASPASPVQYLRYPKETLLVNSYGTYQLLEYYQKTQSRIFIYSSTSEVYGDPQIHPQTENYWGHVNPAGERSCYDEGKRFGEALCMTYFRQDKTDLRIARIFNTYGPYMEKDDGRVISNFITRALADQPLIIYGDGQQTRSFCYVSDLVQALYLLSIKPVKGEIINLGNPLEKTILEIAHLIKQLTHSLSEIVFEKARTDDPKKRRPDITKAQKLLVWHPSISLENGLQTTIKYFQNP